MNNRTFLDIDDAILTKNLILPENAQQIDDLPKQSNLKPFFIIRPNPGICVKTKTDNGEKVFLNICTSDKVPEPAVLSDAELLKVLSDESQFLIPVSIGTERFESDKGGSPCLTYDIAINTKYFDKCQKKENFKMFTILVIINAVSDKFKKHLNSEDFVILKYRKVMGELQNHRIENREPRTNLHIKKPLIEEIKSPTRNICREETEINQLENASFESTDTSKLNYLLLKQPSTGPATRLIGLFQMTKGTTGKDVDVLLDENRVVITVDNTSLAYDLTVPYIINIACVKCLLDVDLRVLRLDMPVQSDSNNVQS
ncbi:PIH1 domain containing 1 isoform X2 [Ptiloglossa arizonensis]|uniref:PIH1 domain containing 1 isoform X2 n=1 Tax=Ptiloglossa arizonensis TaxID=3350558 RepID=UPI003F9ED505